MAYFKWSGVNLQGQDCKGFACAQTVSELDEYLFKQDIALIKHTQTTLPFWKKMGRSAHALPLVQQLAFLLSAGVLLPKALRVVAQQAPIYVQEAMNTIVHEVTQGVSLHLALAKYPMFDHTVIAMARIGVESGSLATAMLAACEHLEKEEALFKKLRSAALVPALTAAIFVLIVGVIFTMMVPRFASLYQSAHQDLPALTQMVIKISDFFCSVSVIWIFCACVALYAFCVGYTRTQAGKKKYDLLLLKIPIFGAVHTWRAASHFFSSAALLTRAGMPLAQALSVAQQAVTNKAIAQECASIVRDVEAGDSLSKVLVQYAHLGVGPDVIALIKVGEESGQLSTMMHKVAIIYQELADERLATVSVLFQPLLVMILGMLIVVVVVAAYLPIFNLSNIF